jgi:hypothetical protein
VGQWAIRLKSKYGVAFAGFHISFYLYPTPTKSANVGQANLQCCAKSADGIKTGTISYLAPSAPAWKTSLGLTSLKLPKDENYHAKVMMSEYITVGHYVVQESRSTSGGWRTTRHRNGLSKGFRNTTGFSTLPMQTVKQRGRSCSNGQGVTLRYLRAARPTL